MRCWHRGCSGVAFCLGDQPFLAPSMLSALVYLWSREFSEQQLSMYGLFNVQGFYLPWVLCAIHVLLGGSAVPGSDRYRCRPRLLLSLEDVQGYRLRAPSSWRTPWMRQDQVLRVSSGHIGMFSAATTGVAAVDAWATTEVWGQRKDEERERWARITRTTRSLLYSFVDVDAIDQDQIYDLPLPYGPRKYKCTEHRPRSRSEHGSGGPTACVCLWFF